MFDCANCQCQCTEDGNRNHINMSVECNLDMQNAKILSYPYRRNRTMLREQQDCCKNIKGEPQIYMSPRPRSLFLWVWFYGGPWQT